MKHLPIILLLSATLFAACDSSEPENGGAGEGELITRVVLRLVGGGAAIVVEASDPDGDGTGFEIDTLRLAAGVDYSGTIELFDDVNGHNITTEVAAEADAHQFFYTAGGGVANRLLVDITDSDSNGLPVGLTYDVSDSGSGTASGTLNVVLSHYDATPKNGTDRSDETDVDIIFPVVIE